MPESRTKSRINRSDIVKMTKGVFQDQEVIELVELTEGYFNVAYRIVLSNGMILVLKVAPPPNTPVMTHEINIMFAETECMKLVKKETSLPVATIYSYDNSHTLCNSDYFFMDCLPGCSFSSCMEILSKEQQDSVKKQAGEYTAQINRITGKLFGYFGRSEKQGEHWFSVFFSMIEDTFKDADRLSIDLVVPQQELLQLLKQDQRYFEEVTVPKLVHWDLWAGNIFIQENKITGLIDFERCLWADELMEVGFRTYNCSQAFLEGYGQEELTRGQNRRAKWYDIYVFLIWCLESDYRNYETKDMYYNGVKILSQWIDELKEVN